MIARLVRTVPFILFVLSGGYALVYEVAWAKYLSLFIGSTTLAHMCVLAAFMGGLALGSIVIGRMTPRLRRPLAGYGVLEIVIGLYAVVFPFFIHPLQTSVLKAAADIPIGSPLWAILKIGVAMGVLLWPTFLMGGTFPMLMRHYQPGANSKSEIEDKSEWLYLTNCVGAVAGALAAGFFLIPHIGLRATLSGVGFSNVALGAAAVGLAMVGPSIGTQKKQADMPAPSQRNAWPIYTAITISGITAMIYELVWIRLFSVTLGSSTYSFTLMLAAFITGIALGSMAVGLSKWVRRNPLLSFALAELAIGFVIIASIPQYEKLSYIFWRWGYLLNRTNEAFGLFNLIKYALCFAVMAAPTFLFGMTLPLAMKSAIRRNEMIGRDSGAIYGANTAGNIVGALLTGLVLIPFLGIRHSLEIALLANIGIGVLLLWFSPVSYRLPAAGVACLMAIVLVTALPQWTPAHLFTGNFRNLSKKPPTWSKYDAASRRAKILYYGEDGSANVAVMQARRGERLLIINGKTDASSSTDMPTQVLIGQLPMFFKPDARDVLLIGLGSGATAGSVLTHPQTRVDCLEISPAVVKSVKCFADVNWESWKNPRMNLMIEDARTYVTVTNRKYDVVISEPSNPWLAGVAGLFSKEHFESVDRTLKPDGILIQWMQGYETSDDLVTMVIRTMSNTFPYVCIFQSAEYDYILMASHEPLKPDFPAMERAVKIPAVKKDLGRVGIDSVTVLLSTQMLSADAASELAGDGPINTDDLPLLEYQAPKSLFTGETARILNMMDERFRLGEDLFSVRYLKTHPLDRETSRSLIRVWASPPARNNDLELAMLDYYLSRWPDDRWALNHYGELVSDVDLSSALEASRRLIPLNQGAKALAIKADILFTERSRAHSAFTPQDFRPALDLLDQAIALDPKNASYTQKRQEIVDFAR